MQSRKIIQLVSRKTGLVALCNDGSVWQSDLTLFPKVSWDYISIADVIKDDITDPMSRLDVKEGMLKHRADWLKAGVTMPKIMHTDESTWSPEQQAKAEPDASVTGDVYPSYTNRDRFEAGMNIGSERAAAVVRKAMGKMDEAAKALIDKAETAIHENLSKAKNFSAAADSSASKESKGE